MKNTMIKKASFLLLAMASVISLQAEKWIGSTPSTTSTAKVVAGCLPPSTALDLDINNIKARIMTGGDMWWDLQGIPKYEVPKGSKKTSLFAGSLWLGGVDVSNQLKVAAQRFRENGVDFYTGPLREDNAETDGATCTKYDKFFLTYKQDIVAFNAYNLAKAYDAVNSTNTAEENFPGYSIPASIQNWPGNNADENYSFQLAPYFDNDSNGVYDYTKGDYPNYDLKGDGSCNTSALTQIYGDQNLWWVFNDNGNIHGESGSQPIGMEIRAQAFAFAANDEVNNMTFYNYQVINRSTFTLTETYFGFWVDADLGNSQDDYVGCDVVKGLGYAYNGDDYDQNQGGAFGYLDQPAAIGVDFFQGPFQDSDGEDNANGIGPDQALNGVGYGDGEPDNERFGMRRFLYHNNATGPLGDPGTGPDYYNFLRGRWKDGNQMVYGGTGYPTGCAAPFSCVNSDFMFPGDSDPLGWGTNGAPQTEPWSEVTAGNSPGDRRFIQSAGPFTLAPGASNFVTVGVVWAQATSGGALASLDALLQADKKTQAAFDNCFRILEGPFAPELSFQEMDKTLIMYLKNPVSSNNHQEQYAQKDPSNVPPDSAFNESGVKVKLTSLDSITWMTYYFQGYKIYQLKNKNVSVTELEDANLARLVAQCDLKDGISRVINYEFDDNLKVSVPKLKVDGENNGIFHSLKITEDLFATGDKALVNHKQMYYMAVAYAVNDFKYNRYDATDPTKLNGQKLPYIQSGKGADGAQVKVFSAIPHKPSVELGGTIINSEYGDGLEITQIEGQGNGGNFLRLKQESIDKIVAGETLTQISYEANAGPIEVKVVDPLNVPKGNFVLKVLEDEDYKNLSYSNATWELTFTGQVNGRDTVIVYNSDNTISLGGEQLLLEVGLSVNIRQIDKIKDAIQDEVLYGNALLEAEMVFEDPNKPWLTGVRDQDGTNDGTNWIRSGTSDVVDDLKLSDASTDGNYFDPKQIYEGILEGTWAPFKLCAISPHGPSVSYPSLSNANISLSGTAEFNPLEYLQSVDIVFTSDKSKWTRCIVVETQEDSTVSVNKAKKGFLRKSPSVDKNGVAFDASAYSDLRNAPSSSNPNDPNYIGAYGMGWFPGYAINVETGERLNMAFGEDSWLQAENGADMIWNPTKNITEGPFDDTRLGGKHYIYVFRNNIVSESQSAYPLTIREDSQMPAYDNGYFAFESLKGAQDKPSGNSTLARFGNRVYTAAMWCSLPLLEEGYDLLSISEGLIPTKTTVRLRVAKPYQGHVYGSFISTGQALPANATYFVERGPITYAGTTYNRGEYFDGMKDSTFTLAAVSNPNNKDLTNNVRITTNAARPLYNFNSDQYATVIGDNATAVDGLSLITAVPNPYYAYSEYETDRLDNRIKIINLPKTTTVRIYSTDGVLIRTLSKDDPNTTYLEWDLKNNANITVASGIYIIHIDAPGVGERVIKWLGMMRPIDLDSF